MLALLFAAGAVYGQGVAGVNIFGGYSYLSSGLNPDGRSSLNGWNASIEGRVLPFIGIVGDFSGQYGGLNGVNCASLISPPVATCGGNVSEHNYLFGPQVSFSVGKFRPFARGDDRGCSCEWGCAAEFEHVAGRRGGWRTGLPFGSAGERAAAD